MVSKDFMDGFAQGIWLSIVVEKNLGGNHC